jgi:hypothetical protein
MTGSTSAERPGRPRRRTIAYGTGTNGRSADEQRRHLTRAEGQRQSLAAARETLLDDIATMSANDNDLAYPFQEGAFFGNAFSGDAHVCRGRDAEKGEQLKRLCALTPGIRSGLTNFSGAGS